MKTRVISASVLLAITALCMIFPLTRVLYLSAAAVIACYEINKALKLCGIKCTVWILYGYIVGCALLLLLDTELIFVAAWFTLAAFAVILAGVVKSSVGARGMLATLSVLIYPLMLFTIILCIATLPQWLPVFILACLATWVCDSFALFGGRRFGKHQLAPTVSPNKTVEGALCGALASAVAGVISFFILKYISPVPFWPCVIISVISSSFGQLGDLAASLIKRLADIKDYSNLIPGHGGMMDRADSLLFSIPTTFFCLCLAAFFAF